MQGEKTVLHWAAMRGHVDVVDYLLMHSAIKTIRKKGDKILDGL